MAISITLMQFLDDHNVTYDTLLHDLTASSSETAEKARVPSSRLVKAVIVRCDDEYKMVLLPASNHLNFDLLQDIAKGAKLATEKELMTLFNDCDNGAIPALGMAYGVPVIVDDSLAETGDIFFEGGDHATLVHMDAGAFETMIHGTPHGHFSHHDKNMEQRGGFRFSHS